MNNLFPKIVLATGVLVLTLIGVEVALRLNHYDPLAEALSGRVQLVRASDSPGRGYELVPGATGRGWGAEVSVNSYGFRGPEIERDAPGRMRLVALGDSVTFGNDLNHSLTWPAVLERELREQGRDVDVLNLALGGYDTAQEVATLEALGLPFQPVHVILGFCVNDVGVVSMSMETPFLAEDASDPLFTSRLFQWWHVHRFERHQRRSLFERNREATYAYAFAAEIDALAPEIGARVAALAASLRGAPDEDTELATRRIPARWFASPARIGRLAHAFARLADLRNRLGFQVTVLLIPYLEEDPGIQQGLEIVGALAESFGFARVDPRPSFVEAGLESLRIRDEDPVHPSARGHTLLATALVAPVGTALGSAEPKAGE